MTAVPIPADVRDRALALLVDYLAVARGGAGSPPARAARAGIRQVDGRAIVEGAGPSRSPADAALLNGIASHSIELDDTHEGASLHPGVAVWPAVLAIADEGGAGLEDIVAAGVAGYDVMCSLGEQLGPATVYERGFHPTGVSGTAGAAAGAARVLGVDTSAMTSAVLLATSMSSGLLTFLDGAGWSKPLQAGHSAAAGLQAALLAAAGYAGPEERAGLARFAKTFGAGPAELERDRGPGHGVMATSVKLYPCCRYMHGCIDLLLELDIAVEAIERVECAVLPGGWSLVAAPIEGKRRPGGPVEAQFSMPFGAAAALQLRRFTLADVDDVQRLGTELQPLMERVECVRDDALDEAYPRQWGAAVRVTTRAGETLMRREEAFLGSPSRPAPDDIVRGKFAALAGAAWADAALAFLEAPDLPGLTALRVS